MIGTSSMTLRAGGGAGRPDRRGGSGAVWLALTAAAAIAVAVLAERRARALR